MTRYLSTMLIGVGLCWLLCGSLSRPAKADPTAGVAKVDASNLSTKIALVDMAKVFKSSKMFNELRKELMGKIKESEELAKQSQTELLKMQKKYPTLEKGSEEQKELEAKLKTKHTEFEEFKRVTSLKFLKEESAIYRKVYEIVSREVTVYAQSHGLDLVIRHNAEAVDENDPKAQLESMNRLVLFENKLDITDEIIAAVADQQ